MTAYAGSSRDLLIAYKEHERAGLADVLAAALAAGLLAAAAGSREVLVVPAPSSRVALRARGDDVLLVLTQLAARRCRSMDLRARVVPALRQSRRVADSAGLGAADRLTNLDHALVVTPASASRLRIAPIVIADDLVTTGATLVEASRALREAGGAVLGAATIAATERRIRN